MASVAADRKLLGWKHKTKAWNSVTNLYFPLHLMLITNIGIGIVITLIPRPVLAVDGLFRLENATHPPTGF